MNADVAKAIGWTDELCEECDDFHAGTTAYTVDDLLTWLRSSDARLQDVEIYDDAREVWDVWLNFHDDSYYTGIPQHEAIQVGGNTLLEALEKAVLKVAETREGWPIQRTAS